MHVDLEGEREIFSRDGERYESSESPPFIHSAQSIGKIYRLKNGSFDLAAAILLSFFYIYLTPGSRCKFHRRCTSFILAHDRRMD